MPGLDGITKPPRDSRKIDPRDMEAFMESIFTMQVPVGTLLGYGLTSAPPLGYILGTATGVSRTTYRRLFQLYGVLHGSGDGSSTFNIPNPDAPTANVAWVVKF